ncbi:MAG: AgmX/PglI C-terminal domain-containing protein [Cellvibrionaceae bacterium]
MCESSGTSRDRAGFASGGTSLCRAAILVAGLLPKCKLTKSQHGSEILIMLFAKLEPVALDLALPWQENPEQESRFRRLLAQVLLGLALLAIVVPWLPVFESEQTLPEQTLTKTELILKPLVVEPEPEPEPEPPQAEPSEPASESPPDPRPAAEPPAVAETPEPPAPPIKDKDSVVQEQGLDQLSSQLSAVRSNINVEKLRRKNALKSDLGRVEHSTREAFGQEVVAKRSAGIRVDDDVLRQENVSLSDYRGVAVEATAYSDQPGGSQLSYLSGQAGRRDMENIRRTFEAAKSRVYSIYLQALHERPDLAGKFIFRLVIEPDGSISELELVSSELGTRELEQVILDRIRDINFGPKNVAPTAVEYAFSFLPS